METNNQMGAELSPEQLKLKKDEMLEFYTESMPYLNAQLEYEKKLAEIDEVRFKRFSISMQSAMMMQEPSEEEMLAQEETTGGQPTTNKKKKPLRTT
jgi:hypothetical protein